MRQIGTSSSTSMVHKNTFKFAIKCLSSEIYRYNKSVSNLIPYETASILRLGSAFFNCTFLPIKRGSIMSDVLYWSPSRSVLPYRQRLWRERTHAQARLNLVVQSSVFHIWSGTRCHVRPSKTQISLRIRAI